MTLTKREKFLIVFGLIVVSLTSYIVYFLMPYLKNSSDAELRYAAAQSQLSTYQFEAKGLKSLEEQIAELKDGLGNQTEGMYAGIDHARILLYIKKLTDGRVVDVNVQIHSNLAVKDRFLTQAVTVDFRAPWAAVQQVFREMKANEVHHRVTYLRVDYLAQAAEGQQAAGQAEGQPGEGLPVEVDRNVITVHMEMLFFALQPSEERPYEPAMGPSDVSRWDPLFPVK